MLITSDAEPNGQGKEKKQASDTRKISPQQYHRKRGHQGYRSRGGQHLIGCESRSDFPH